MSKSGASPIPSAKNGGRDCERITLGSYRKNGQSQTQYHYFFGVGSGHHGKEELTLSGKIQPDNEK